MTDLERFFERLVRNLAAIDTSRVEQPVLIMDIKTSLVPYRTNRRALGLESAEEYEELLVRLCSEEGGYVTTNPPDVAEWCQRQMSSLTPDLSGIPGQATATVTIRPEALSRVLGLSEGGAVAGAPDARQLRVEACPHCKTALPGSRAVNFCPVCGRSVLLIPCEGCGADLEPGWRFCVNCGGEVTDSSVASG